jgi:membrane protein
MSTADPPVQHHDAAARGREAESPTEIPARGWKDIAWRLFGQFTRNRVMLVAAGVTFYGLLALFPGITALVSIYGLFADPETVVRHAGALSRVLPPGAVDIISGQMERIAGQPTDRLSVGFALGLGIALWSTNSGVKSLLDAINVAYGEHEERGFLHLNAVSFLFTLGGIAFIILALSAIVIVPVILGLVGVEEVADAIFRFARWPLLLVVVIAAISILYRYGPSRSRAQWRWITPGAAFAALAWLVVSILFSWYVANFDSYNETYGSLGAVVAFMMWMWLSAMTLIIGAMIDAEVEHQTARDSTTGPERPMGERGARVADTVGQTSES